MSQIHDPGDHRPTIQGLNQEVPGFLQAANKPHKVTIFSGSGASRKGNFFTKLASKVSAFVRSIFSATAALDIKRDKTEIRELTEKHSKITAPIKAAKKAPIEAEIKKLNNEIIRLKNNLYYERNQEAFKLSYDSAVDNAKKELADAHNRLDNAKRRLKKIK